MHRDRLILLAIAAVLPLLPACQQKQQPSTNLAFASGATATPGNPSPGQVVTISFQVIESDSHGNGIANVPWRIVRDGVDGFATGTIAALTPGTPSPPQTFTVQEGSGTHTYYILLDPDGAIAESNEGDNVQQVTLTWGGITPPPGVNLDFALAPAASPSNPTSGTPFNLTFTVGAASGDGTGAINVGWSVARDGVGGFATGTIPSIAANGSVGVSVPLNEAAGSHTYQVTIDPGNTVVETNEGDNVQSVTVPVSLIGNG